MAEKMTPESAARSRQAREGQAPRGQADWIARQLRRAYAQTLDEPVPDHFLDLVRKIEGRNAKDSDGSA